MIPYSHPRLCVIALCTLLLAQGLRAQTITYTDGQTDTNDYSNPPSLSTYLFIDSGAARQTGVLSGTEGYNKIGAGKLSLSAANTFTGGLVVYDGTLNIFNDSNLGASASQIQLGGFGATLQTSSTYSSHALEVGGGGTIDVAQGFTTLQNAGLTGGARSSRRAGAPSSSGPPRAIRSAPTSSLRPTAAL